MAFRPTGCRARICDSWDSVSLFVVVYRGVCRSAKRGDSRPTTGSGLLTSRVRRPVRSELHRAEQRTVTAGTSTASQTPPWRPRIPWSPLPVPSGGSTGRQLRRIDPDSATSAAATAAAGRTSTGPYCCRYFSPDCRTPGLFPPGKTNRYRITEIWRLRANVRRRQAGGSSFEKRRKGNRTAWKTGWLRETAAEDRTRPTLRKHRYTGRLCYSGIRMIA